jgi:hypothetical protein
VKLRKRWLFLGGAILIVAGALVLARQHQPVRDPETGAFQRYELEPIAKPFFPKTRQPWQVASAGAGERSAAHDKNFDYQFVIRRELDAFDERWLPI